MRDVITFGSATRDVFLQSRAFTTVKSTAFPTGVAQCVSLGSKIELEGITFTTGGGATNAAVTFARQGFDAAVVGSIGRDIRGTELLRILRQEKIATSLVVPHPTAMTGYAVILVNTRGRRTVLVYRGAAGSLTPSRVSWKHVRSRWVYITSLGGNLSLLRRIVRHARTHGARIALNPGSGELQGGAKKLSSILRAVDILLVNREEAALLTRTSVQAIGRIERRLDKLCKGTAIITAGIEGATAFAAGTRYVSSTHKRTPRREATGAGDAFGSGVVASLIRKPDDLARALQFGTANAESVVQYIGAKEGILRRLPNRRSLVRVRTQSVRW